MENRELSSWELCGSCPRVSVGGGDVLKPRDAAAEGRRRCRRAPGTPPVPSRQASEPQPSPGSPTGRAGWAPSGAGRPKRRCQPREAGSPLQAVDDVVTVEPSAQPASRPPPARPAQESRPCGLGKCAFVGEAGMTRPPRAQRQHT